MLEWIEKIIYKSEQIFAFLLIYLQFNDRILA